LKKRVRAAAVAVVVTVLCTAADSAAQQQTQQPRQSSQTPNTPGAGAGRTPAGASTPATPTAPGPPRVFTAPVGLILTTVRSERVADFEKVLSYVQAALEKSTDPRVQAQAKGWRMFKASEPGPNGSVLYVFGFDPAVPGADYGLFRVLADAYSDTELQQLWRLYNSSVTSGGSLLNLTPLKLAPPEPLRVSPSNDAPPQGDPRTPPVTANPNVPDR
jgi:hypothetical protein